MAEKQDIYTRVTNKIVADLERGELTWHMPWSVEHLAERIANPQRHNGVAYKGINILLLWIASLAQGYASNRWMTYRQAKELGGQVRKGSRGETVVYAGSITVAEPQEDEDGSVWLPADAERRFLKTYTVFNVEQIDNLPESFYHRPAPVNPDIDRDARLDAFFSATGATIEHRGTEASYNVVLDRVRMPPLEGFHDAEGYYATLAHEMTHWTRHPSRLDRDFGRKKMGDEGYAKEELVAELGAAFLCAQLHITPEVREDHAAYIEGWLQLLQNDKKAIFRAAAHAQRAVDYLMGLQPDDASEAAA